MTEEVPTPATVTPLRALPLPEAPTAPAAVLAEPVLEESAGVPVASSAEPAPSLALPAAGKAMPLQQALAERLRILATRTLPIAWYRVTRVGPAGLIGAAATLAALLIAAIAVIGGRNSTASLMSQLASAQGHPSAAAVSDASVGKVVAELPTRQQMPAVVGLVLEQARAANVQLDNVHYSYSAPKGGTIGRYELEFPVKADYPSVRNFINRTLSAVPAAGLDKLRIERKVVGDATVSADIRFVVFVRAQP